MRAAALAALGSLLLVPTLAAEPAAPAFPVRMVSLVGDPADPLTRAHLEFCAAAGFNAVWVYSPAAGRWTDPGGPTVHPKFLDLARFCKEKGLRIFVSLNPIGDAGPSFAFSDPDGARRIRAFFRLLRRKCDVRDFLISLDDMPRELVDVRDIATYDGSAAAAHLDLVRRVFKRPRKGETAWMTGSVYSDWHLEDEGYEPYATEFLEGLSSIDPRIGIAWTGPDTISESITLEDVRAAREKLGGRELLLCDNYPINDDHAGDAIALLLGPLRQRDPRIRELVSHYVAVPMRQMGASRLPLATIADFLRDPAGYDPDQSWNRAIRRLAGDDPVALDALKTQALEWGGWIGTMNYHYDDASPPSVARELDNPALMATWSYTLKRYPERMEAIGRIADTVFRNDVLAAMARRLSVARVLPLVLQLHGPKPSSTNDPKDLLRRIQEERDRATITPGVRAALDRFLEAAGILKMLEPKGAAGG